MKGWPRDASGMTLLEILVAVAILAVIALAASGTLRVGLRAWEAGERQVATHQEVRTATEILTEALASAHPYRARTGTSPQRVVLFQGSADEVRFVTGAAPLGLDAPAVPFHAVRLRLDERGDLRAAERLLPNEDPFEGPGREVVVARSVRSLRLQYEDDKGLWQDTWDGRAENGLPVAIRVDLTFERGTGTTALPSLLVSVPLGKRAP